MADQTNILAKILEDKRSEIEARKQACPLDQLKARARARSAPPPFAAALKSAPIGLIAEVKRRSPSAGIIRDPFLPAEIAFAYQQAGAQAVSVLIDEKYFGGGESVFSKVRSTIELPMLYKEFVVDEWQLWHAAALGASAVLLIASAMEKDRLRRLIDCAHDACLEVLFEVHDEAEMSLANELDCRLTGINNRDLRTFDVSLETTLRLKENAPPRSLVVSESGIKCNADVQMLQEHGVDAILVGQQLLEHGKDPAQEILKLMGRNQLDDSEPFQRLIND